MTTQAEPIGIVRCRATKHGLLILFSDGQVHLFHTSFLVQNRLQHGDRVVDSNAIKSMLADTKPIHADGAASAHLGELGISG